MASSFPAVGAIMGSLIAGGVILMAIYQEGRNRELKHKERMKALEMGKAPPGDETWGALVSLAIGCVVPITAFVVALVATLTAPRTVNTGTEIVTWTPEQAAVYYGCVWGAAISVSIVSAIAGSLLGWFVFSRARRSKESGASSPWGDQAKPQFDPDSYDTVGTRG